MKKAIISFIVSALVLAGLALWATKGRFSGNAGEILMGAIVLVVVGFAVFLGVSRLRSGLRASRAKTKCPEKS